GRLYGSPHEPVLVLIRLPHDVFVSHINAFLNPRGIQLIERIAGNNTISTLKHFGIETGWPISATDNPEAEIVIGQRKHAPVFVKRSAPWNRFVVFECHMLRAAHPNSCRRGLWPRTIFQSAFLPILDCARSQTAPTTISSRVFCLERRSVRVGRTFQG